MDTRDSSDDSGILFRCEQCQRLAGQDMLDCPERPVKRCPYVQTQRNTVNMDSLNILVGALVPVLLYFALFWLSLRTGLSWLYPLNGHGGLLILLGATVLIWFDFGMQHETTLYNPRSGRMCRHSRNIVFRRVQRLQVVVGLRRLEITPPTGEKPRHPYSIIALHPPQRLHAVHIVKVTLLSLLANQQLEIRHPISYRSHWGRPLKPAYHNLLVAPGSQRSETLDGDLERRIVAVVDNNLGSSITQSPLGITIFELTLLIFDTAHSNPHAWLVSFVADDAIRRGMGQWEGKVQWKSISNRIRLPNRCLCRNMKRSCSG